MIQLVLVFLGLVTTVAGAVDPGWDDGQGSSARFYRPRGLFVTAVGDIIVGDTNNHRIRSITNAGMLGQLLMRLL